MTHCWVGLRLALAGAALWAGLASGPRPAAAADLVRWRTPDGREGLADDASRVPPGAEIVSTRRARDGAAPAAPHDASRDGASRAAGDRPGAGTEPMAEEALDDALAHAGRCAAAGLARECSVMDLDEVAGWRGRARVARERRARAEERAEAERERWERCRDALTLVACPDGALEAAEAELARAVAEEERITESCRREGCRPGWLLEEPFPEAGAEAEADYED